VESTKNVSAFIENKNDEKFNFLITEPKKDTLIYENSKILWK
jgi:hypothetical protein